MKAILNKKETKSFNIYYRQLCFVAIAIIWLFTEGDLSTKYDGGWILYGFSSAILGLVIDFILQIFKVFKCKLSNNIFKLSYLIFQILIIAVSYAYILKYLLDIYSQDKA